MTIRHNFYVFFAVSYIVFLAVGFGVGLVLASAYAWNVGHIVNLLSFAGGIRIATLHRGGRLCEISAPPRQIFFAILRTKLKKLAICFALLAVSIDAAFYMVGFSYFTGAIQPLNEIRLLLMALAYSAIAYFQLDWLSKQGMAFSREQSDAIRCFTRGYQALGDADKSVLVAGLKFPGSPMLTTSGSANDLFWQELSGYQLMERDGLPEGLENSELSAEFAAWTLTEAGRHLLPLLIHKFDKQN